MSVRSIDCARDSILTQDDLSRHGTARFTSLLLSRTSAALIGCSLHAGSILARSDGQDVAQGKSRGRKGGLRSGETQHVLLQLTFDALSHQLTPLLHLRSPRIYRTAGTTTRPRSTSPLLHSERPFRARPMASKLGFSCLARVISSWTRVTGQIPACRRACMHDVPRAPAGPGA